LVKVEQHKARHYVGDKGRVITDYNSMDKSLSCSEDQVRLEYWMAKQIGTELMKYYPGREWHVDCDARNQVIIISCPSVSKTKGYRLHMKRDTMAQLLPRCRMAAGEILERHNVSRTRRILDPQTLEAYDRDIKDNIISSDSMVTVEKWNRDK
jgi:hypothetical protein